MARQPYLRRHQEKLPTKQRLAWIVGIVAVAGALVALPFRWYERLLMLIAVLTLALLAVALILAGFRALLNREGGQRRWGGIFDFRQSPPTIGAIIHSNDQETMAAERSTRTKLLITGAGGPAAVSFMKGIRDEPVDVYAADMDPHAAGLYLVPAERRMIVPAGADPNFVPRVAELCERFGIDVFVPTVDSELLPVAKARRQFESLGVRLLLAPEKTLEVCLDKFELMSRCNGVVPIPRSAVFDTAFVSAAWEYPLMVKPRAGSGSRGIRLVGSQGEMDTIPRAGHLLVQEFLPGEEYSVDVLASAEGRVIAAVPRLRMKVDSGIAVTSRTVKDADLEKYARDVANAIGLTFTANIQFRRNRDGVPCLMEVNARFPGTMPLTVASGVNMPLLSLRSVLGDSLEAESGEFRELAMVRYWEEQYLDPGEIEALRGTEHTVHEA